jgi:hypothetical protein
MTENSQGEGKLDLDKQAWLKEPPRSGHPLSPAEQFARFALNWGREWIRRNYLKNNFAQHPSVAVALSDSLRVEDDARLAEVQTTIRPLGAYAFPLDETVFLTTAAVKRSAGFCIGTPKIDHLLSSLKARRLDQLDLVVIDPSTCSIGLHTPDRDLMDIELLPVSTGSEPVVTPQRIDQELSRFHAEVIKLPKQFLRAFIWLNINDDTCFKTLPHPERIVHSELFKRLISIYGEKRVLTDYEVEATSGRADIRITEAVGNDLHLLWLELKVLREAGGPNDRSTSVVECIAQARARYEGAPGATIASFACCYDASKLHEKFSQQLFDLAAVNPAVELRQYEIQRKLYDVKKAPGK